MTETTKSKRLARLQALEALAAKVRIWCASRPGWNGDSETLRGTQALFDAIAALDALPADPARGEVVEVVEVAVWEYQDGEIHQARAGSNMDRHYHTIKPWTRLGIVRLLLVKGDKS